MAGRLERAYAVTGIVYYEQGIIAALRTARGVEAVKPGASDVVSTIAQLGILSVLVVIVTWRGRDYARLLAILQPYLVIIGLCFVSVFWSDNPWPTMRRSVSLASCVLFGTYLWQSFGLRGTIRLAGGCTVMLGLLSVAVFVAVPGIGRETAFGYESAMRGVFSQKNVMAECMLLGVSCFCFRILDEGARLRHVTSLLLLLACIVLGRSATSLGIAGLVVLATALFASRSRPRLRLVLWFGTGWLALALAVTGLIAPDLLFALIGRDASLTGRGPLWHEVIGVIAQRPLFGHGYAGFWNDESVEVQYLWLRAGWRPPDSHNGYLDVTVQLGAAGLLAYLFLWGRVSVRAVTASRAGTLGESRWIVLFMLINIVLNLDEGPMPFADGFTLLMPGALLTLGVWHGRYRVRRHRQPGLRAAWVGRRGTA